MIYCIRSEVESAFAVRPNAKAHEHPVKEPTTAESDEN